MIYDLAICNGVVVTVNPRFEIVENGFIGISEGKIQRVGTPATGGIPEAKTLLDARGGIVLPGLVNTHSHLPMTLFRGLADDLPLMAWLNDHIFPAERNHITPGSVRLGSLLGCAEMLLSGTTTCCDGYFYEDHVAQAILASGMRAIVGQGVIDFPAPGVPDPSRNIQTAVEFVEKWSGVSPLLRPSIFCHSPYTCSEKTLKRAKDTALRHNVLFQIHAAETREEVRQIRSDHQSTPMGYLDKTGLLDKKTLLVHSIWVNEEDIALIQKSGAGISVNTESHMKLASGIAPVPRFLASKIPIGLGTDGCASNNDMDLFREMDMTAKLHKVNTLNPTLLNAETVLRMATIEGARALGLGDEIGSIEPGKQADIIILYPDKPHLAPLYHPASHLVYAASGGDVKDVMVGGKLLVRDHKLLTLDVSEVMREVRNLAEVIRS